MISKTLFIHRDFNTVKCSAISRHQSTGVKHCHQLTASDGHAENQRLKRLPFILIGVICVSLTDRKYLSGQGLE